MNNYKCYSCYMASMRAQNPAFKALWERLAAHFEKEFINENRLFDRHKH